MYSEFTSRLVNAKSSFDYVAAHFACEADKYSADNPNGYVNLGSEQNFLSKQDIAQRLKAPDWSPEDTPYRQFSGTDGCFRGFGSTHCYPMISIAVNSELTKRSHVIPWHNTILRRQNVHRTLKRFQAILKPFAIR